jgi:hypothetical protein
MVKKALKRKVEDAFDCFKEMSRRATREFTYSREAMSLRFQITDNNGQIYTIEDDRKRKQ